MRSWKMNDAGNDFIILSNLQKGLSADCFPALTRRLRERHLSIGTNGLMVVERPQSGGDYRMLFYNSDGSAGEMCGSGARRICRRGHEVGLAGELQRVETTAGLVTSRRIARRQYKIELNRPITPRLDYPVGVDGKTYPCSYVELGDPGLPHAVVPLPGLRDRPEAKLFAPGRELRVHLTSPKGVNVNFFDVEGPGRIRKRTFERGVEGFTYACSMGTGSVAAVLTLQGVVSGRAVAVQMTGGELVVSMERRGSTVEYLFLTGPTNMAAKGELTDEELPL